VRTDIRKNKLSATDALFAGPTVAVARRLIGAILRREIPSGDPDVGTVLLGRIVETEAYLPLVDPACHAYRGPTKRTASLFGRPGFAYVYLIYGMHYCLNVTTEPPGIGAAVLIRAAEPLAGIDSMRRRRRPGTPTDGLASGPGNLCTAFAIDLGCDGVDLRVGNLTIAAPEIQPHVTIGVSPRIGLSTAHTWPLRFFDPSSPSVSPFRRGRKFSDPTSEERIRRR
jgi:DNA-3-methyladenine glycosylase